MRPLGGWRRRLWSWRNRRGDRGGKICGSERLGGEEDEKMDAGGELMVKIDGDGG